MKVSNKEELGKIAIELETPVNFMNKATVKEERR